MKMIGAFLLMPRIWIWNKPIYKHKNIICVGRVKRNHETMP